MFLDSLDFVSHATNNEVSDKIPHAALCTKVHVPKETVTNEKFAFRSVFLANNSSLSSFSAISFILSAAEIAAALLGLNVGHQGLTVGLLLLRRDLLSRTAILEGAGVGLVAL